MRYPVAKPNWVLRCAILMLAVVGVSVLLTDQSPLGAEEISAEVQLNPHQIQLLQALGLRIAVPTYMPRGFTLEKVLAEIDRQSRIGGISYTLFYRRYDSDTNQDFCFAIEATNGGIGDIPTGSRSYPINASNFGKSSLEYGVYGRAKGATYLSNWLGTASGPFYRFVGAGIIPEGSNCTNMSVQESIRVTESLQYLSR
ncbi:MAG: hypothetical protein WCD18_28315 [Thermosynechococcaceae cyanobacterium]